MCLLHHSSELEGRIKVVSLQESFIPDISTFARWQGGVPRPLTEVTICYRLKIFYYRPEVTVFSYFGPNGEIRTGECSVYALHFDVKQILEKNSVRGNSTFCSSAIYIDQTRV